MEEISSTFTVFVDTAEWKKAFGRPMSRWKDNIKMYLRKIDCKVVD
jgi:hypothetical protein